MQNAKLNEAQAGIKTAGKNINNLRYADMSVYNAGDPGSIPGLGRSHGEGDGNPLQYSCQENSTD